MSVFISPSFAYSTPPPIQCQCHAPASSIVHGDGRLRQGRTDGRAMLQKRLKKVEILLHENRNYRFNIQMKSRTVVQPGVTHKKLQRQQFGLREKTYAGSFTLCNTLPCTYYVVRASPWSFLFFLLILKVFWSKRTKNRRRKTCPSHWTCTLIFPAWKQSYTCTI